MRVSDVIGRALAGELDWAVVPKILRYSPRHVRRLREKLERDGVDGLRDGRAGRPMPNRIPVAVQQEILRLRKDKYSEFNVRHFHETLQERHGVTASYTYVKTLLQAAGLAEQARGRGKHRRKRERRPMRGMMLHMDGSTHEWLGPEQGQRDLIWVVDDADGRPLYGRFVPEEDTASCLAAVASVLRSHGLFQELYVDRGSHFVFTPKAGGPFERGHTQVERILDRLGITMINAYSPQARGRSERSFRTVQGRLPAELGVAGITDWDEANRYLNEQFMPDFERRFTVEPQSPESAFIPLPQDFDIDKACALEYEATVRNDHIVQWDRREWPIPPNRMRTSYAKCRVRVVEYLDGRVSMEYGGWTIARFDAQGQPIDGVKPVAQLPRTMGPRLVPRAADGHAQEAP